MRGDLSIMVWDDFEEEEEEEGTNRYKRRELIYYSSAVFTVVFLITLFCWCYIIIVDMEKWEET